MRARLRGCSRHVPKASNRDSTIQRQLERHFSRYIRLILQWEGRAPRCLIQGLIQSTHSTSSPWCIEKALAPASAFS